MASSASTFYPDEEVRAGLSVLPEALRQCFTQIPETGLYACNRCGTTREIPGYEEPRCPKCGRNTWSLALNKSGSEAQVQHIFRYLITF